MRKKKVHRVHAKKGLGPYLASHPAVLIAVFVLAFIVTSLIVVCSNPKEFWTGKSFIHTSPIPAHY